MAKHRSRRKGIQDPVGQSFTVQLPLPVLGVLSDTREALHELCIRTRSAGIDGDDGSGP